MNDKVSDKLHNDKVSYKLHNDTVSDKLHNDKLRNENYESSGDDDDDDEFLYLLANPDKKTYKSQTNTYTIDDEIIRLLNMKLSETYFNLIIDKEKFEKIINYIKILK